MAWQNRRQSRWGAFESKFSFFQKGAEEGNETINATSSQPNHNSAPITRRMAISMAEHKICKNVLKMLKNEEK